MGLDGLEMRIVPLVGTLNRGRSSDVISAPLGPLQSHSDRVRLILLEVKEHPKMQAHARSARPLAANAS